MFYAEKHGYFDLFGVYFVYLVSFVVNGLIFAQRLVDPKCGVILLKTLLRLDEAYWLEI
jgi:hypothetical protein